MPPLDLLALILLAALAAAGVAGAFFGRRDDAIGGAALAGVGFASVGGAAVAVTLGGPGAIPWWWLAGLLAFGALSSSAASGPAPASGSEDMSPGSSRLGAASALVGLLAALSAGALLHARQAAEVLRDGLGLGVRVAGPLLAALLLALALAAPARARALAVVGLVGFGLLAAAAVLADPAAAQAGLADMLRDAGGGEAAAAGLLAAVAQAVLWATLATGAGFAAAEGRRDRLAGPVSALVATLSALLVAAGGPRAPLAEPTPAELERFLGAGLQPSEYGQTVVLAPDAKLEPGKKYPVVLRADPRGHKTGDLLGADNIVALQAWAVAEDVDAIVLRDTDPERAKNPGFDVHIPCVREIVETRIGNIIKLRPRDPHLNIFQLMRARDLDGPYVRLRDYHFEAAVRRGIQDQVLLYEEPRAKGGPKNPNLRDLIAMGYAGPYLDGGGATEAPPLALVGAAGFAPAPGERLHLRLDAPARGLALGFVNRLGELEVPAWDFLAGATVAVLRHETDPALDRTIPVVNRLAFGRLRFSSSDPSLAFDDLSAHPGYSGPHLVPPSYRFDVEVRSGARLPAEWADRRALVSLGAAARPGGNPGVSVYTPHPAEVLLAGMAGPVRDQFGAAQALPGLAARLGKAGAGAAAGLLGLLAVCGLSFWLRCGQRWARRSFGGGEAGVSLVFFACVVAGPLCDPSAIATVALPAVGLTAVLGLLAQPGARKA